MDNVYRFKKFGENALPLLMVDCTELENCLSDLSKIDSEDRGKTTASSYTNFVVKTFHKTKNILKLLSMPIDSF